MLASREAQGRKGNGLLHSFEFWFRRATFQCRRSGIRWTVERRAFRRGKKTESISVPSFEALLDSTLPKCRKTTVREALSRCHAFDVEVFWREPKTDAKLSRSLPASRTDSVAKGPRARSVVEAPLDGAGLYGLEYESAATPRHFRSVRLTDAEVQALFPAFKEMNAKLGVRIDRCEEAILPSFLATKVLAELRSFRDRAADPATRKVAEKVLPVFEKAAELRMPVAFQL